MGGNLGRQHPGWGSSCAVGLWCLDTPGTHLGARGRGCCRALLNRSIADARDLGYPVISLQASVYGEPIYASVGMEVVSHMVTYILK